MLARQVPAFLRNMHLVLTCRSMVCLMARHQLIQKVDAQFNVMAMVTPRLCKCRKSSANHLMWRQVHDAKCMVSAWTCLTMTTQDVVRSSEGQADQTTIRLVQVGTLISGERPPQMRHFSRLGIMRRLRLNNKSHDPVTPSPN